jgi:hypothetical protein
MNGGMPSFVDIVVSPCSHPSNPAENAEKPLRATVLAEPFPGAVAQRDVLGFAKGFSGLGRSGLGMPTGIRRLDARESRTWIASIFAAVDWHLFRIDQPRMKVGISS